MKPLEQYQAYSVPVAAIYYDALFNCRGEFTLQSLGNWPTASSKRGG